MKGGNQRNMFRRALAMFAAIAAAAGDLDQLHDIGPYRSRGKGRGTPSRNYMRPVNSRRPHDGMQERHRRRLGGWAQVKRREGMTKQQYMNRQMEM